jgi:diguanylate cyclase (GGDEF)-like protein/PAS domain S-box-containing protein
MREDGRMNLEVPNHRRVLIVDDNGEIHEDFRKILAPAPQTSGLAEMETALFGAGQASAGERYELEFAFQGQEALERVRAALKNERPFALAFVDMRMPPGWDGLETIEHLWHADPELQVVICTAYSEYSREDIVARTGRSHRLVILKKPFDIAEISQLAFAMTEKWRASRQAGLKMVALERVVQRRTAEVGAINLRLSIQIEQLEQMKEALESSEKRYALAARGANDGLWDWDLGQGTVYYSDRWRNIVGLQETEAANTIDIWHSRVHPNDLPVLQETIRRHLDGETDHMESEHRIRTPSGEYLWVLCRGVAVRNESGKPCRFAGSLTDISRRKATEDQLRQGAYFDRLTDLPNRALLRECLERAVREAKEDRSKRFAVLFIDFDRFKVVNDSLGHMAGDELLVAVSRLFTQCLRGAMPTARDYTLARLGGDEFIILLTDLQSDHDAVRVAEAVHGALHQPLSIHGQEVHCTASIGIAIGGPHYQNADDIIRDADTAMYHAKTAGRARHVVFSSAMHTNAIARLQFENDLRRAIQNRGIEVVYQPIICLKTTRAIGVEALARWTHPDLGPVSPDRFIPVAEESGLIIPLGDHVLQTACRDLHRLQTARPDFRGLRMNVNLSSRQFSQPLLVDSIRNIIEESGIAPGTLALEVTETVVMKDFEAAASTIERLKELSVDVYMDDFGTGYSSLSCLKSLPMTGLKLDRSFVGQISASITNPAIIHAIVTLAGNLRLHVVAEGVETMEQVASLIALDCEQAQGYLFGRPMPLEHMMKWSPPTALHHAAA